MERYCIVEKELSDSKPNFCPYIRIFPFKALEYAENHVLSDSVKNEETEDDKSPEDLKCSVGINYEPTEQSLYNGFVEGKEPEKEMLFTFPECEAEIQKLLLNVDNIEYADSERDMYFDILDHSFSSKLVNLDIYLHIYYSLLYKQNKESYIALTEKEWTSEQKIEIREKRKECKKYFKGNPDKFKPFVIREKINEKKNSEGKVYYDVTGIQNFAPNVSRLYYLSREVRQIFTKVKKINTEKYSYNKMKSLFDSDYVSINRIEEIWLCEYLFGLNLAIMFYSFFEPILKDICFEDIKREYYEIIKKIILEVMKVKGIYTRCLLIQKMKMIYELKFANSKLGCRERLHYLYSEILNKRMSVYVETMGWLKKNVLEQGDDEKRKKIFIKEVEKNCKVLIAEYLLCSEGYYLLKDLPQNIENDNIYELIQKIILCEREEGVPSC